MDLACHMACDKLVSRASLTSLEVRLARETCDKPEMSTKITLHRPGDTIVQKNLQE